MKKTLLVSILLTMVINSYAQEDAWVYLKDKQNVEQAIANPLTILTQRAIDRKSDHGIPIDARDVPVNEARISEIKAQPGIQVWAKSKWFNAIHVRGSEADITNLLSLEFVERVEFANRDLDSNSRSQQPKDKFRLEDILTDFNYGSTANQVEMIAADRLHRDDYTGEGILIAVMDSGFPEVNTMQAFSRVRANNDILGGYDFQRRTDDVYGYTGSAHGTWVLSDMAGFIEDQFVGTAPDASYVLYRTEVDEFENPVEESYWVEAAERADSLGVDIINTSLGYKAYDNSNYSYSDSELDGKTAFITRGASIASEKGMLVVTSAGNSGTGGVGAPADSELVFSIGAVDANEQYVSFSSRGNSFQPSIKPDVSARGGATFVVNTNGDIINLNGTSFSSPVLAGGMACLMQALPDASVEELKELVRTTASQSANPDFLLGYGIPNLALALERAIGDDEDKDNIEEFRLYPNPVRDELFIELPDDTLNTSFEVYDILGKLILESTLSENENRIDTSFWSQGLYLLKLNGSINQTFKLIKS